MHYQHLNQITKNPQTVVSLASLLNPATIIPALSIAAIGIAAAIGVKAYKSIKSENERLATDKQALKDELKAVNSYKEAYNEPLDNGLSTAALTAYPTVEAVEQPDNEAIKKELIRQAMSELGKRSGKKRKRNIK